MGVPGLAATLFHKYKHTNLTRSFTHFKDTEPKINSLYLDANCLIHPVCMRVYNENKNLVTNLDKLEELMVKQVIKYIDMLYTMNKPTDLFYIAIDGVAPVAKIKHQRFRRFKSIKEQEIKENIARKHNKEYIKPWNNSAITPGTIFMKKIAVNLVSYLNNLKKDNMKIVFSSCNVPAEGEHKILQYIRKNKANDSVKMIYGLDADLLFLALASNEDNIYLLRETNQINFNIKEGFSVVDIDCMKECIYTEITTLYDKIESDKKYKINKDRFLIDYIFMGFILGNDFLPPIPSINFRFNKDPFNGHNILLETYSKMYEGKYLIKEDLSINYKVFKKLIDRLTKLEEQYFIDTANVKKYYNPSNTNDPYENELYNLENLYFKIQDPIQLGIKPIVEAKSNYYNYYKINKEKAIKEYIDGLHWVILYYLDECPDWKWFYTYDNAPFISDINDYLTNNTFKSEEINKNFINKESTIKPLQQLLMVLPTKSGFLLPQKYRNLMYNELKEHYPIRYELDFLMKHKFWQAMPKIEMINPDEIIDVTDKIPLTDDERYRNKLRFNFTR